MGKDAYPRKLPEALKLLQQFKGEGGRRTNNNKNNNDGMQAGLAFAQHGLPQAADSDVACFSCSQKDPKLFACPDTTQKKKDEIYAQKKAERANKGKPSVVGQAHVAAGSECVAAAANSTSSASAAGDYGMMQEYEHNSFFLAIEPKSSMCLMASSKVASTPVT